MVVDDSRGRAPRCTRTRCMVGDDARGRARAHARARATMHKNTMIEDDARGRHDAQEFQKSPNRKIHGFQNKIVFLELN